MASPLRVAVIGLGRAGNARVRDIPVVAPCTAGMEHITLAGFVSRRSLGQAESGAKQLSLDEVLSSSDGVNAVVIATENASHEQFIRQALVAKKHVCVDFPLVPDATTAKELLKLAKDNGVVLYEEDIAMLQDKYEAAKKLVNSKGKMIRAEVNMSVGGTAWLEDIASSGSPFHTSMDILHTMVDYFGDLTPLTCTVVTNDKGTQACGTLGSKEGGTSLDGKKRVACSYTEYLGEIEEHLDMWLHCVVPNGQEPNWRELLLRYRLDQQFPEEVAMHLADKNIVTAAESADLADEYLVQRKIYARTTSQRDTQNENYSSLTGGQRWSGYSNSICTFCQRRGHVQSECYSDPKSPLYRGARRPSNQQINANTEKVAPKREHDHGAYCANIEGQSMVDQRYKKYTGDVYIAQKSSADLYLRDTGSTLSFLSRDALPTGWSPQMTGTTVTVTGIHQSRGTHQLCKVPIVCDLYEGDLTVALTNRPPLPGVALVLGNDVDDETYEEDMSCGIATRRRVYDPPDPLNDGTLSGIFDEECREDPSREGREDPSREGREDPSREGREDPSREGREDPSGEGREDPSREGREDPSREGREDSSREGRKDPSREGREEEDYLVEDEAFYQKNPPNPPCEGKDAGDVMLHAGLVTPEQLQEATRG
ncbi:hypothetical protein CAPTEDRAFT_206853 [Capitella teleta]|uniref:Gfo/Idh/MocA-like oxidoreductase N-terminal domain-containing protein n=1 Tax=Capitella teleta TaxID=283909 RepID=R7TTA2_CAPTE|nr:hypothetical protein CAPTEDRAFT_206853 [Capitella teleta]|eukprot:ELT94250.1 hypothetical protein CAPTEDRAFT_206853 [Capitella teleta]